MTPIDAAPLTKDKPATIALRDRGQGEGDAETGADKPRFGDHWRKVLSGGDAKDDFAGSSADTEGAEDQLRFPRFGALLRLPAQAVAVSPDGAGERDIPALGGDVAPRDDKIDITEVLTALKNAGRALDDRQATPVGDGAKNAEAGSDQGGSDSNGRGLALAAELLAAGNGLPNQIDQVRTARDAVALPAPPAAPLGMQAGRASARIAADRDLHLATRADAAQPALERRPSVLNR